MIPQRLVDRELAHPGLTELRVVETLHERKAMMAELSDGFIALPGGLGTLEELAEVASWAQLDLHAKPIGLLGPDGYWDGAARLARPRRGRGLRRAAPSARSSRVDPDLDALLAPVRGAGRRRRRAGRIRRAPELRGRTRLRRLRRPSASATGSAPCPGGEKSVAATARIAVRSGTCDGP